MSNLTKYATDPAAFFDDASVEAAGRAVRLGDCATDAQRQFLAALAPALLALATGKPAQINRLWWTAVKGNAKTTLIALAVIWLTAFSKRMLTIQAGASDQDQAGEVRTAAKAMVEMMPWLKPRVKVLRWKLQNRSRSQFLN